MWYFTGCVLSGGAPVAPNASQEPETPAVLHAGASEGAEEERPRDRRLPLEADINEDIAAALAQTGGGREFVWYENPKMTIPGVYHVQVFSHHPDTQGLCSDLSPSS
jgi:hypothetical protein